MSRFTVRKGLNVGTHLPYPRAILLIHNHFWDTVLHISEIVSDVYPDELVVLRSIFQ